MANEKGAWEWMGDAVLEKRKNWPRGFCTRATTAEKRKKEKYTLAKCKHRGRRSKREENCENERKE